MRGQQLSVDRELTNACFRIEVQSKSGNWSGARSGPALDSKLVPRAITALAKKYGDDKLMPLSVGSVFRSRMYRATMRYNTRSDTAQTISSKPRHHESQGPGMSFSVSTKAANAAIQIGFMTPPTNSSAIKAQQQPTQ